MRVKIKSHKEIKATLDKTGLCNGCKFAYGMMEYCGKEVVVNEPAMPSGNFHAFGWFWRPEWLEVLDADFNAEDTYIVEELNQILSHCLEAR